MIPKQNMKRNGKCRTGKDRKRFGKPYKADTGTILNERQETSLSERNYRQDCQENKAEGNTNQ